MTAELLLVGLPLAVLACFVLLVVVAWPLRYESGDHDERGCPSERGLR